MSDFLGICLCRSHLLDHAEPLPGKGSTCEGYCIELYGRQYFLKKLKPEFRNNPVYISLFTKEFTVGKGLSHPNIINYVKMETSEVSVCMLMDYVAGKTVQEILTSEPEYFLSEKNLRRFLTQLLKGLDYLHSHQIVHCDLTTSNVLLTQVDKSVKILDLGFCYTDSYSTLAGKTDEFAAPELRTKLTREQIFMQ